MLKNNWSLECIEYILKNTQARDLSLNKNLKKIFSTLLNEVFTVLLYKTSIWNVMFNYFIMNEQIKKNVNVSLYTIRKSGNQRPSNQQEKSRAHR